MPNVPFGFPKKEYISAITAQQYTLFSNHHIGIEPCDDYIVNIVRLQIYFAYLSLCQIKDKYFISKVLKMSKKYCKYWKTML